MNKSLLMPLAIVVAGGLVAGAYIYINQTGTLSPQEATEKAMAFINQSVQDQGVTASLLDVVEESGIYKIHLKIAETEYESYITKDGNLLFSSAFNLEAYEVKEEEPREEVSSLEDFAKCLTSSGAKFYGAYWCGACNSQKEFFGEAAQFLPYIECSDQDRNMLPVCQKANITDYPTWEFNGEKSTGVKSFEQLAELSGCSY